MAPDERAARAVSVFSRADDRFGLAAACRRGVLSRGFGAAGRGFVGVAAGGCGRRWTSATRMSGWRRVGTGMGPAFQGLTAMWRRGDEVFAEVALPADCRGVAGRLRGAPGGVGCGLARGDRLPPKRDWLGLRGAKGVLVPFSWQRVSLHAAGASAVRARISPSGPSAVSVELADGLGLPVLSVTSMVARPVTEQQLKAALSGSGGIGSSRWSGHRRLEISAGPTAGDRPDVRGVRVGTGHGDAVAGVYAATHKALAVVQSWLAEHDSGVLLVATRGAVALPGEDVTDLAGAAVWGLVRSAQTEHPGRIVLVDADVPLDDEGAAGGFGGR